MRHCIEFGASAYAPKSLDVETMRAAIRTVLEGGQWTPPDLDLNAPADREASALVRRLSSLTPQQVRVLMMLSQGLLNKQIAYELARFRGDGEGACLRDPAEARRRQPHPGGHPRRQDRAGAGAGADGVTTALRPSLRAQRSNPAAGPRPTPHAQPPRAVQSRVPGQCRAGPLKAPASTSWPTREMARSMSS